MDDKITRKPRTRANMIAYLSQHFRYDTMNSWNCSTSYAVNIKVDRIDALNREETTRALELLECDDATVMWDFRDVLNDFDRRHEHRWQIGQNGRSGGYLVLYQGGRSNVDGHVYSQPGLSTDQNEDFSDWDTDDLRARVELVWDFDQTCARAVQAFVDFVKQHRAEERTVKVSKKITVAVPLEA
jgi:hypothetical protein